MECKEKLLQNDLIPFFFEEYSFLGKIHRHNFNLELKLTYIPTFSYFRFRTQILNCHSIEYDKKLL
jgi:hypothetical protein